MTVFKTLDSILALINCLVHVIIFLFITCHRALRKSRYNQLIMHMNIGYIVGDFILFLKIVFPRQSIIFDNIAFAGFVQGMLALVCLSIDRCFKILRPFLYQAIPSKYFWVVNILIPLPAVLSLVVIPLDENILQSKEKIAFFGYMLAFVMIFLVVTNTLVYITVLKQKRSIRMQVSPNNNGNAEVRNDFRSFYMCLGCVVTFVMFWLPSVISTLIWVYSDDKKTRNPLPYIVRCIIHLNPSIDAIILVWFNKELRGKMKRFLTQRVTQL